MGKHGPCHHCGVASTPLWRNGPPEKPVLCNACGSRWRTKGTLVNYTPLHARAEPGDVEDYRVSRVKSMSVKSKEAEVLKRKQNRNNAVVGGVDLDYNHSFRKGLDEDTSNRSSSGSAISNSDSCVQFGSHDASDLTDPAHSIVWDSMVPSRKRTCIGRPKASPVEKLTKDLYTILHEQRSSHFSGSSEDDLLFESDTPMVSVEIGHGSILIRHPSSIAREEESEASSLSFDHKRHPPNEAYSQLTTFPVDTYNKKGANFSTPGLEKNKKPNGQGMQHDIKRAQHENPQIHHNSSLRSVDLKDVLDFDQFASNLTNEEQQQLLKYLPSVDTARLPDSLQSMFASPQFKESISSFQKLHAEGVFDLSFSEVKAEDCRTLKKLTLGNLTKSKWVEQYNLLKDVKFKSINEGSVVQGGRNTIAYGNSPNVKRLCYGHLQSPGSNTTMKIPKRATKGIYEHKEFIDDPYFSPRSLFSLPSDSSPLMLDSLQFMYESSDQDLLLNVPSNSSFPEAELLCPASSFHAQASTSSSSVQTHLIRQ